MDPGNLKNLSIRQVSEEVETHPTVTDIRDLFSYRVSRFSSANDQLGQAWASSNFGLRLNEWRILGLVHAREPVAYTEISKELLMDKALLSRLGNTLIDRGLIKSSRISSDRRVLMLSTTAKGKVLHDQILESSIIRNQSAVSDLSQDELNAFFKTLDKLTDTLRRKSKDRKNQR